MKNRNPNPNHMTPHKIPNTRNQLKKPKTTQRNPSTATPLPEIQDQNSATRVLSKETIWTTKLLKDTQRTRRRCEDTKNTDSTRRSDDDRPSETKHTPVSYNHLTLPTHRETEQSLGAVKYKKKQTDNIHNDRAT